ncbi:MAG: Jag N-terminal domain-containing protein [Thiovulaceae bacterium]|nr:Jag N-terminal domain-containing protein [Sulfurimonadaceae bacterium]MCW9026264.1 Jag N-terminal domain-containing protein [Sulfurimonadaceae bacterium]
MIKIEALTLEEAYSQAATKLECSVTELKIEVVQVPSKGVLGLFKKSAVIVAAIDTQKNSPKPAKPKKTEKPAKTEKPVKTKKVESSKKEEKKSKENNSHNVYNDTIMPQSFVSTQDESYEDDYDEDYIDDEIDEESYEEIVKEVEGETLEQSMDINEIVDEVKNDINKLFENICFDIDDISVSAYDDSTLLIEFTGTDAALLIGKEGYRYKALSYMIFNWINAKYQVGLRLEIAEFLKNQEESVTRYLEGVHENVNRDGRAQTKILDGVLVQIALKELRNSYPDKYVAIRTTRDGLKYIIINDYHNN